MGADALVVTEFFRVWGYTVPSLPIPQSGIDSNGHEYPTAFIATSPNMGYIPDITKGRFAVQAHADGRFGLADFTLCPQWYFQGTYYLPYMRKRPENIETDELGKIWYDLKRSDFVLEKGGIFAGLGRIRKDLADDFITMRKTLATKIKVLESDTRFSGVDCMELLYAKQAMQFASIILQCAPQTFELTLLTVTGFQRHFLEALACYEYLTIYRDMICDDVNNSEASIGANTSLMGTFTTSLELAEQLYRQKVPVWLVRVPSQIPLTTNIVAHVYPTKLDFEPEFLPNSQPVYTGHASAIRNRACQALKVGNIRLGHGAYTLQPGDFNAQFVPEKELKHVYTGPLAGSSSSNTPSSSSSSSSVVTANPTQSAQPSNVDPFTPQWQTISQRLCVNMDKFAPVSVVHCPSVNIVWVQALQQVIPNWRRIFDHENLSIMCGYALPDPSIFVKETAATLHGKQYTLGWLAMRSGWIARLADVTATQMTYPKPQEWKDLITVDVARALGFSDRVKESFQSSNKRQKMSASVRERLGINWDSLRDSPDVYWRDIFLFAAGSPRLHDIVIPEKVYKEVVWDVTEQNFRLELLALDRSVFPRQRLSTTNALSRDEMVAACLPRQAFICVDWPAHDEGLGALRWEDRMEYVEAFRLLLSTWPGSIPSRLKSLRPIVRHSGTTFTGRERDVLEVEQLAYPFYCQTFFDYFGRAPSIPAQCPV